MTTSLVFLVVLGIWAAYLVQHWLRRREHLLTARSVDTFTEALRVLERRPDVDQAPRARSYAVSPLRAPSEQEHGATAASVRPVRRGAARVRAAGLAACLALVLLAAVGAALGHVSVLLPVAAVLLLAGDIAYLRWSARAAAPVRTVSARVADAVPQAPVLETSTVVETVPAEPVAVEVPAAEVVVGDETPVEGPAVVEREPELFDIRAFDEPAPAPVVEEPPAPGTWRPTPVPAPLYTRKAAATPAPAVLAPVAAESDSYLSPVSIEEDLDAELLDLPSLYGRVVNG